MSLFHLQDLSLPETVFEETCMWSWTIHCDEQLSRQRKERTQGLSLFVLEEKFLKCIPWEFLPLNETLFYSLYTHHMSLLDLLGMSAQTKCDSGSSVLKQFFLLLQKLGVFQHCVTETMRPPSPQSSWLRLLPGLGSLQTDTQRVMFKICVKTNLCGIFYAWDLVCVNMPVQEKAGQHMLK